MGGKSALIFFFFLFLLNQEVHNNNNKEEEEKQAVENSITAACVHGEAEASPSVGASGRDAIERLQTYEILSF